MGNPAGSSGSVADFADFQAAGNDFNPRTNEGWTLVYSNSCIVDLCSSLNLIHCDSIITRTPL